MFAPYNAILTCGKEWRDRTYTTILHRFPGPISDIGILRRTLASFSRFHPCPILGMQELWLDVNVVGGANLRDNTEDVMSILQQLPLFKNLESLTLKFNAYYGIRHYYVRPDQMPYNDSFLDVFAALTEMYVKKVRVVGLYSTELTQELEDLMMGKTVWDDTRELDVWEQNRVWYEEEELRKIEYEAKLENGEIPETEGQW